MAKKTINDYKEEIKRLTFNLEHSDEVKEKFRTDYYDAKKELDKYADYDVLIKEVEFNKGYIKGIQYLLGQFRLDMTINNKNLSDDEIRNIIEERSRMW